MAHTKFILTIDRVLSDEEQLAVINALEPIAAKHGLTRELDVLKPSLRLEIYADHDPLNPRVDWDNASVMYCRHSRYDLGDKDAEDPYVEVEGKHFAGRWLTEEQYEDATVALYALAEEYGVACTDEDNATLAEFFPWNAESILAVLDELEAASWDVRYELREDIAICRPLYLYDHSGITISAGRFNDPWDSGQVGWQYVTKQALAEEWGGDEILAMRNMEAELETYDQYLRGEVYGFQVFDEDGDAVGGCSGFFGNDPYENGMADHFPKGVTKEMVNKALENIVYG